MADKEWWMPEFKMETRRYMFWLARIFGKRQAKNIYSWRGVWYVCGDVEEAPDER